MSSEDPSPYSIGGSSARNILDLPKKILINTFAEFESLEATNHLAVELCQENDENELAGESGQTIASARLVCRQFNEAASQFLIPVVLVELSQASLDSVDAIPRSSGIASGIRVVRVAVNCRLEVPAINFEHFVDFKTLAVGVYNNGGYGCPGPWNRAALPNNIPASPRTAELKSFMLEAHGEYRRK